MGKDKVAPVSYSEGRVKVNGRMPASEYIANVLKATQHRAVVVTRTKTVSQRLLSDLFDIQLSSVYAEQTEATINQQGQSRKPPVLEGPTAKDRAKSKLIVLSPEEVFSQKPKKQGVINHNLNRIAEVGNWHTADAIVAVQGLHWASFLSRTNHDASERLLSILESDASPAFAMVGDSQYLPFVDLGKKPDNPTEALLAHMYGIVNETAIVVTPDGQTDHIGINMPRASAHAASRSPLPTTARPEIETPQGYTRL